MRYASTIQKRQGQAALVTLAVPVKAQNANGTPTETTFGIQAKRGAAHLQAEAGWQPLGLLLRVTLRQNCGHEHLCAVHGGRTMVAQREITRSLLSLKCDVRG